VIVRGEEDASKPALFATRLSKKFAPLDARQSKTAKYGMLATVIYFLTKSLTVRRNIMGQKHL
jgi:hypothetical protein